MRMLPYFLVFLGGGLGSVLRYGLSQVFVYIPRSWPMATFASNVLASVVFGLVCAVVYARSPQESWLRPLVISGLCGGLSTFSTFNHELYGFIIDKMYRSALVYSASSIFFCLLSFWLALRATAFLIKFV